MLCSQGKVEREKGMLFKIPLSLFPFPYLWKSRLNTLSD